MPELQLPRRSFLSHSAGSLLLPLSGCLNSPDPQRKPLHIGLIAGLHHGLDPRVQERLEDFLAAAQARRADMIVQLGDFNYADAINKPCMAAWNSFAGKRHHVLGNHDVDRFGKEHVLDFWQMRVRYYSFDREGVGGTIPHSSRRYPNAEAGSSPDGRSTECGDRNRAVVSRRLANGNTLIADSSDRSLRSIGRTRTSGLSLQRNDRTPHSDCRAEMSWSAEKAFSTASTQRASRSESSRSR